MRGLGFGIQSGKRLALLSMALLYGSTFCITQILRFKINIKRLTQFFVGLASFSLSSMPKHLEFLKCGFLINKTWKYNFNYVIRSCFVPILRSSEFSPGTEQRNYECQRSQRAVMIQNNEIIILDYTIDYK